MIKLKVKEAFNDLVADIRRLPGTVFEVDKDRLKELKEKAEEFGGFDTFLEIVDEKKKKAAEETPAK